MTRARRKPRLKISTKIAGVHVNPTWVESVRREPLLAFSFYLNERMNVLAVVAEEIIEHLDHSFDGTGCTQRVVRADTLMWFWILGAYEVVRTICQAKVCFSERAMKDLLELKRLLAAVRIPAAKMERPGEHVPVTSDRSFSGWDVSRKDLIIGDPDRAHVSARFVIREFDRVMAGITPVDILGPHGRAYATRVTGSDLGSRQSYLAPKKAARAP